MGYFPMCVDLRGKRVLLVGSGPQTDEKLERLHPFGGEICRKDSLTEDDLTADVALVVAGDLPEDAAKRISALCRSLRIPVNIVDRPSISTFFFPALVTRGDLTVSVSTGGGSPVAASVLRSRIADSLPDDLEGILQWLSGLRQELYLSYPKADARRILRQAAEAAFELGRPLSQEELETQIS